MVEEVIIEFMRNHSFMFDVHDMDYKNIKMKEKKWLELANQLNIGVIQAKKKWKMLKDSFFREDKKRNLPSGSAAVKSTPWKYYESLLFLKSRGERRRTSTNCEESSSDLFDESVDTSFYVEDEEMIIEGPIDTSRKYSTSTPETPSSMEEKAGRLGSRTKDVKLEKNLLIQNAQAQLNKIVDVFESKCKNTPEALFFESVTKTVEKAELTPLEFLNLQKDIIDVIQKYVNK